MVKGRYFHRRSKETQRKSSEVRDIFQNIFASADSTTWVWTIATTLLVVVNGALAGLAPLALKTVIDNLGRPSAVSLLVAHLATPVAIYVGVLASQRAIEQVQTYFYSLAEQRLIRNFSSAAYGHILTLPLAVHLEKRSGALSQSLTQGVLGIRLITTHLILSIAPLFIQLVIAAVVLSGVLDATLFAVLIVALVMYCAAFTVGIVRLGTPLSKLSERQVDAGGLASDGLMNVEAIKAYTAERRFSRRYELLLGSAEQSWEQFSRRRLENGIVVSAVFAVSCGAIFLMSAGRVATGQMTLGGFVLVNAYVLQLVRPVEMLGFAIRDIGQGLAYLKEIAGLIALRPEGDELREDISPIPSSPGALAFNQVSFGFGDRTTIDDVSFDAPPGAMIGIVGRSGAGKSSLLRLVLRLYDPWSGKITLDGVPLASIPLEQLRRQIALVSQDTILFHDTIAANIRFAVDSAEDDEVETAAARAHLTTLLADLPDGLDTLVGERGLKLSGGEKQRVSIARAALKQARLVIFDEATAALDPATERAVWTAMHGLAQGATTLVVTHRLTTVRDADQILVLDHGKIVERGTHPELLAAGGVYASLWRAQEGADPGAPMGDPAPSVRESSPARL